MPMSNDTFYAMVQATLLKCLEVMQTKGKEYTESSDNKLANFEAESLETDMPVLDVIHLFSNKHQRAINNYRKTGQVESEALEMRFVDRINYLFLELAECIALGYEPREAWLIAALDNPTVSNVEVMGEPIVLGDGESIPEGVRVVQAPDTEPCCGHPGNEQCCEAKPKPTTPSPSTTTPSAGDQEKQQRRRPARPRTPQDDDNIPIATPDRRFDPEVVAERARTKRQQ